jgi:hypothetical protein
MGGRSECRRRRRVRKGSVPALSAIRHLRLFLPDLEFLGRRLSRVWCWCHGQRFALCRQCCVDKGRVVRVREQYWKSAADWGSAESGSHGQRKETFLEGFCYPRVASVCWWGCRTRREPEALLNVPCSYSRGCGLPESRALGDSNFLAATTAPLRF